MSDQNTSPAWKTKYGPRRVRHDPPTVAEALAAARDLTDERDQQVEIAASLMGVSQDQVLAELAKLKPQPKAAPSSVAFTTTRTGMQRAVVVERKPSRRIVGAKPLVRSLTASS